MVRGVKDATIRRELTDLKAILQLVSASQAPANPIQSHPRLCKAQGRSAQDAAAALR